MASRAEWSSYGSNGVEGGYGVEISGSLTAWFQINWAPDLEKFQAEDRGLYTGGISTGG